MFGGQNLPFFDEIQEVKSWKKVVNSRMMSSEISTYLTGRYITFHIFPLSFAEYRIFCKEYTEVHDPRTELANYLRLGGFPAVHLQKNTQNEFYTIVKNIYSSTIFTDIVRRNQIRKLGQLERIVKFAFEDVGPESACILHRCSRFGVQGKEILKTQEKFYLADPALRYSVLGYSPDSVAAMLKNVINLELLRLGYDVYVGKLDNTEIDFIAIKQESKVYIQVAQKIGSPETERREYGRMLDIRDNYPKYVSRTDIFAGGNYERIKTMHIAAFLLSDEYKKECVVTEERKYQFERSTTTDNIDRFSTPQIGGV